VNYVTTAPNGPCRNTRMSKIKGDSDPAATPPADPSAPAEFKFELSLEDTLTQHRRGVVPQGSKGVVAGYNPYDTPIGANNAQKPVASPDPKRKPTDLRKLSEWIRLQRQVEALKKQGGPESGSEPESD